jgi:solute carrier family 50 protein (sugar transporter)
MYSIMLRDYFIFFGNCFGLVLSLYYVFNSLILMSISDDDHASNYVAVEYFVMVGVCCWVFVGMVLGMIIPSRPDIGIIIVAATANFGTIAFYTAPVLDVMRVIRLRDASSLELRFIIATTMNSSMWFIYGLAAINNYFVWSPNVIGVVLGVVQMVLIAVYGNKQARKADGNLTTSDASSTHDNI